MPAPIEITIIRSNRKSLALRITGPRSAEVRAPLDMPQARIDAFLNQHRAWLEKHMAAQPPQDEPSFTDAEIRALAEKALKTIPERVRHFAPLLGVSYGRVTIRNQKSKWGSCSSQGNLNFNCLLVLCPPQALDYVVIHELCHRREMNHSPACWALVERAMPDYQVWREWLKKEGAKLIRRL